MLPGLEEHDCHVVDGKLAVGHAAGLDDHDPQLPVDAARIAERVEHEPAFDELQIGLQNRPLQVRDRQGVLPRIGFQG